MIPEVKQNVPMRVRSGCCFRRLPTLRFRDGILTAAGPNIEWVEPSSARYGRLLEVFACDDVDDPHERFTFTCPGCGRRIERRTDRLAEEIERVGVGDELILAL